MTRERIVIPIEELSILKELAARRNGIKFEKGVRNQRYTDRLGDFDIHYQGIQGEYAVALWFRENGWNADIDRTISPGGDDKVSDLVINDVTIQVKSRERRPDGDLYFNHPKLFRAHIAILTIYMREGNIIIPGWTTKEHFMQYHNQKNFGYGTRYCLEQKDLLDLDELK